MRTTPPFRSSIPKNARPRVTKRHPSGTPATVEYLLGRSVVGYRHFDHDGALQFDCGQRKGRHHGTAFRLDEPGKLLSTTPYRKGLEHGLARQWSADGRLIGTYRMRNGTGIDFWWLETFRKPRRLFVAEVHFMFKGRPHGYEWWLNDDERSVWSESHWANGELHGIERRWRGRRLEPGYPRFFVLGERVSRSAYARACVEDLSLPTFFPEDDQPRRVFPPAVAHRLERNRRQR
jgi:hypothetical protein